MIFKELTVQDVYQVADYYRDLANHIQEETDDDYFLDISVSMDSIVEGLFSSLNDDAKMVFVAKDNDKVVGFIAGEIVDCFLPITNVKKVGYISAAYVVPTYRGKGILQELESMIQDFFKQRGLKYIELNVLSQNQIGITSWGRLGYSTFREQMRKEIK